MTLTDDDMERTVLPLVKLVLDVHCHVFVVFELSIIKLLVAVSADVNDDFLHLLAHVNEAMSWHDVFVVLLNGLLDTLVTHSRHMCIFKLI